MALWVGIIGVGFGRLGRMIGGGVKESKGKSIVIKKE